MVFYTRVFALYGRQSVHFSPLPFLTLSHSSRRKKQTFESLLSLQARSDGPISRILNFIMILFTGIWFQRILPDLGSVTLRRCGWIRVNYCAHPSYSGLENANLQTDSPKPRVTDPKSEYLPMLWHNHLSRSMYIDRTLHDKEETEEDGSDGFRVGDVKDRLCSSENAASFVKPLQIKGIRLVLYPAPYQTTSVSIRIPHELWVRFEGHYYWVNETIHIKKTQSTIPMF